MRTTLYCILACLVLIGTGTLVAQTQTGKVSVVGVSDRFKSGNANESTFGIPNVGVGARVVLKPLSWSGTGLKYNDSVVVVTSATWAVTGPKGAVTITDTTSGGNSGKVVYFKPDTLGNFTVTATITTARGNVNATLVVKAANFTGVGIYKPATQAWDNLTCSPCHSQTSGVFADFKKTNHATVFPRRVNEVGGHFGKNCLPCHTTGWNTSATALNGGYDDVSVANAKKDTLWLYPATANGVGVYDSLVVNAPAMMQLAGIQCETCHGPAGEHIQTGDPAKMAVSWSSDVCAPCHFSSDRHPKGFSWEGTAHSNSLKEGEITTEYLNRSGCSRCHTGNGYVDQTINGNPEPVTASGVKTYPVSTPITCQACHDPHNNTNIYQLRAKSVAETCTGCHITRLSSRGLHHSHQGSMLVGTDFTPMSLATMSSASTLIGNYSGWQFPGYFYDNSSHSDIQDRCAECHMAASPDHDPTFASPDTLLNKLGGHTWKVKYDPGTPTVATDDILNDTGCRECHGSVALEYVELSQAKVKTLLSTLYALLPKRDTSKTTYPNGTPSTPRDSVSYQVNGPAGHTKVRLTETQKAAAYNYQFVEFDGSFGVHNNKYAEQLLRSSIEQLQLGAGAASITSIKDLPNDQGRRVQIVWNQFPGEYFAYNPVVNYGVWREDNIVGSAKAQPKKSFTDMISTGVVGQKYSLMAKVWTFVAAIPASKLPLYGYVAETAVDSISGAANGVTNFYIAGYSVNNAVVYQSPILSGYSIDNIAPFKVTQFTVTVDPTGAVLNWKPVDQDDVVEFLVYRGTTSNFTPTTPLATVKGMSYTDAGVTTGQAYWYIVQGVDKSGNKGEISSPTGTTGVEMADGVPTEYALGQNYPNPFNPTTVIPFSLPNSGHVVLKVYTISGEEVATLVDREMGAGNYNFTWDGRNKAGMTVATGMYLYRLQSDKFSSVKKMVLVK